MEVWSSGKTDLNQGKDPAKGCGVFPIKQTHGKRREANRLVLRNDLAIPGHDEIALLGQVALDVGSVIRQQALVLPGHQR